MGWPSTRMLALILEATRAARYRDHNLGRWEASSDSGRKCASAACVECGRIAMVEPHPMPNSIEISGEAVAVGCHIDQIEHAAAKFQPRIEAFLRALRDAVQAETGVTGGEVWELDEEYGWGLAWSVDHGSPTGHGVDVKLFLSNAYDYGDAEEEQNGQLVNVMIECVKYGGQIVISYAPCNFTEEVWVDLKENGAVDELSSRLAPIENGLAETVVVVAGAVREELSK